MRIFFNSLQFIIKNKEEALIRGRALIKEKTFFFNCKKGGANYRSIKQRSFFNLKSFLKAFLKALLIWKAVRTELTVLRNCHLL